MIKLFSLASLLLVGGTAVASAPCQLGEVYFRSSGELIRKGFTCETPVNPILQAKCTCTDAGTDANGRGEYRQEGYYRVIANPQGTGVDSTQNQFVNPTSGRTGTGGNCYFDWDQGGISICD